MAAISVPEERHPPDDSELGCPLPFDLGHFPGRDRLCSDFYGAVMLGSGHRFLISSANGTVRLARPTRSWVSSPPALTLMTCALAEPQSAWRGHGFRSQVHVSFWHRH